MTQHMQLAVMTLLIAPGLQADDPHRVVREDIEWLDVWIPGNNITEKKPKVLLVGDSITRGYYKVVDDQLKDQVVVCRLTTSKSLGDSALLDEIKLVLGQSQFDVIHFNNGMHGWGYSEMEYSRAIPELIATIRKAAPRARLIWAHTTPVRKAKNIEQIDPKTERVRSRNAAAARVMKEEQIPINDLFELVMEKPDWFSADGVHLNTRGSAALGAQVANLIRQQFDSTSK